MSLLNSQMCIRYNVCLLTYIQDVDHQQQRAQSRPLRAQEEWMLICQRTADLQPDSSSQEDFDWTTWRR